MRVDDLINVIQSCLYFQMKVISESFLIENAFKIMIDEKQYCYASYEEEQYEQDVMVVGFEFEKYIDVFLNDRSSVEGIALSLPEGYILFRKHHFQWMKLKSQDSDYDKYLDYVKWLWNQERYQELYEYIYFLSCDFTEHIAELIIYDAKIFERVGNYVEAETYYREAIKQKDNDPWLYYELADFYKRNDKYSECIMVCEAAYKQSRFHASDGIVNKGIIYIVQELIEYSKANKKYMDKQKYAYYLKELNKSKRMQGNPEEYAWIRGENT